MTAQGSSHNASAALEPLPAVANNLLALADALTDPTSWNLPAGHCRVVAEPEAQRDMLDPVKEAADHARDTLLVYFANRMARSPALYRRPGG